MPSTSLQDADKKLRDAYLALAQEFKAQNPGRNLVVTCTYRDPIEQLALFHEGRGQDEHGKWVVQDPAKIVTQLSGEPGQRSRHNAKPAEALDVCVCIGGKVTWDPTAYLPIGPLALKHGLVWGGSWPHFKDYPHLELPKDV